MNKQSGTSKASADKLVKTIRRKTRQTYSAEEKIRIVLRRASSGAAAFFGFIHKPRPVRTTPSGLGGLVI